jgi:hypothetical protein
MLGKSEFCKRGTAETKNRQAHALAVLMADEQGYYMG